TAGTISLAYNGTSPNVTADSNASVLYNLTDSATSSAITSNDGIWHLLSFSSGSVRYRFSLRVVDTNRRLNLNTGNWGASDTEKIGKYLTSPQLNNSQVFNASDAANVANLQNGQSAGADPKGRGLASWGSNFKFDEWQSRALGYEAYGMNPASNFAN